MPQNNFYNLTSNITHGEILVTHIKKNIPK